MSGFIYILGCIFFTVYGQLILKWRINFVGAFPESAQEKAWFLVKLIFTDLFILSGFVSAFVASIFWMGAMTKFSISFAYPFMSLAFLFVMVGSVFFFKETMDLYKIVGTLVVMLGLVILSQSK